MSPVSVIILAAGLGKRMGSPLPKVLAKTSEKTLIEHVVEIVAPLRADRVVVVTGHGREQVEEIARSASERSGIKNLVIAVQEKQLGTGDAARAALEELKDFRGTVMIVYGDCPLLRTSTLDGLLETHVGSQATLTLVSVETLLPLPYGRVIRNNNHMVEKVVEERDCSPAQRAIRELNVGIYAVESAFLGPALSRLSNNNAQGEYYLTDIVEKASVEGQTVVSFPIRDLDEAQGVNTLLDLAMVNRALRKRKTDLLLLSGVLLEDPDSCFIDSTVEIASGVRIGPNVQLRGGTKIAGGVVLEGTSLLRDVSVGEGSFIRIGVRAEQAVIGEWCTVGPFAHLRPETELSAEAKVGNFVETKKAKVGKHSSVAHLTYLGDCSVGSHTNIGAGTITANYDGVNKHFTRIGDNVSIGSDTVIVAPVEIGEGATIGAGSVIQKDVAPGVLALTRAPLTVREGYRRNVKKK